MKLRTLIFCAIFLSASITRAQSKDLNTKNGNVIISPNALSTKISFTNQLHVSNKQNQSPLLWGDFQTAKIKLNGKTGIGFSHLTPFPTNTEYEHYNLFVAGGILTDEMRVKLRVNGAWPDYVFKPDYKLASLEEIEAHIAQNGHLINVPTASQIAADGINVAEMATIQQEKIEELTLHLIAQNKMNKQQSAEIAELKAMVKLLLEKPQP